MKKSLLNITVLVFFLLGTITVLAAQTVPVVVKKALDSTVRLVLEDVEGSSLEIGSGFFVGPGQIVCNLHVLQGAVGGYAQLSGKRTRYAIESITRSKEHSLAILKVSAFGVQPLSLGSSDNVEYGDIVYAVGNSSDSETIVLPGTMRARYIDNIQADQGSLIVIGDRVITGPYSSKTEWLQITAPITRGISGGPVLNSKGEIIGVATHRGGAGWQVGNFAVSSKTLKALFTLSASKSLPSAIATAGTLSNPFQKKTYNVQSGGRLTIKTELGAINVQTADWDKVGIVVTKEARGNLDREVQRALADFDVTFEQTDSNVHVEGKFKHGLEHWLESLYLLDIRFQVTVPRRYNAELKTALGGDIQVGNVGGAVKAETSVGNLRFGEIKGSVWGRTSSGGSITVKGCQSNVDVMTSVGDIALANVKGTVEAKTSSGGDIEIEDIGSAVKAETSVGNLRFGEIKGSVWGRTSSGGSITVKGCQSNVDAMTSVGDIALANVKGTVEAKTSSGGDIEIEDIGGAVKAETSVGNLRFGEIKGSVWGRTSSGGSITVKGCQSNVDVMTSAGNIRAEITSQPQYPWILDTSSAGIVVTLIPQVAVNLDAQTSGGRISTDFQVQGRIAKDRVQGTINGGGALLKLWHSPPVIYVWKK